MTTRWLGSRWVPGRSVCGGAGGGGGGGAPPSGFSVSIAKITPDPLELGAILPVSTQFNVGESGAAGPLVTRTLQDDDGNGPVNILAQANPVPNAGMGFQYSKTAIGDQVVFTYAANDGVDNAQAQTTYTWLPRVYTGSAPAPGGGLGAADEAFIEGLGFSELRSDKGISDSSFWGGGEWVWVAFPQAFNPTVNLDFLLGILPGGFTLDTAGVSVTPNTPNGVPILYDVWRSVGQGIGVPYSLTVQP